jgi:hypothetical protein
MYKAVPASFMVVVVKPMRTLSSVLKRRVPAVAIAAIAVVAVAMLLSSGYASAAGPKSIRGYTYDNAGRPLQGTDVVLEVWTPLNTLRFTDSTTTDVTGFYSFLLNSFDGDWSDGDTFTIIATYSGVQRTGSLLDDAGPWQWINLTFPFEIPQFGSYLGFGIAAGGVGLIAMVFVVKRKKD